MADHNHPAIQFESVSQTYRGRKELRLAVKNISLSIQPGEFVALVGPSGCGKSTLLNLAAGFQHPTEGKVSSYGKPITKPDADRGLVFQQHRLFPWLSVRKNVEYGPKRLKFPKARVSAIAEEKLKLVGLSAFADNATYELSGGQQQRAAIARALAANPRVLLMDEPFSALDALTRENLQEELIGIWKRTGVTIIFVTHSIDEAVFLSSRTVIMSSQPGEIILDRQVGFSSTEDYSHSRKLPEFGVLRDELTEVLKAAASQ